MTAPPAATVKTLRGAGPVIVIILIVAVAFLGYYQVIYYPTIAAHPSTTSSSSNIVPNEKIVVITIPQGAQDPSTPTSQTYLPNTATVYIGYNATVMWINNDTAAHTVTAKPGSPDQKFDQFGPTSAPFNNLNPDQNVTFTFTIPGIYSYYCSYHSWMKGEVIVKPAQSGLSANSSASASATTNATTTTNSSSA